ncbi:hypothetical protein [Corynebacterium cystitidis]|uniref:hypothetical protein n=1 Tax=Corynebacterium cystitidis TaxID=35757 RepID=UPI00211DD387|nr:hypothetical protein [Corynebacterium cystitidis]
MKRGPIRSLGSFAALALALSVASCAQPNEEFSGASTQQGSAVTADSASKDGQEVVGRETHPQDEQPDITTGAPVPAVETPTRVDQAFIEDTLNAVHTVLKEPTVVRDMSQVLSGQAAEDIDNQRIELETTGLRLDGDVSVTSTRTVDSPQPDTVTHDVCVDNSDVRTLDENNNVISSSEDQGRSRMLLTFTRNGQLWTLSELTFPDDPNC